jgi:hypothetical protein
MYLPQWVTAALAVFNTAVNPGTQIAIDVASGALLAADTFEDGTTYIIWGILKDFGKQVERESRRIRRPRLM